jgi:hypothetical protein
MKKNKKKQLLLKAFSVIFIILLLGLIILTVKNTYFTPEQIERRQVEKINQEAGPLLIEEEYLGPNTNTPITIIEND